MWREVEGGGGRGGPRGPPYAVGCQMTELYPRPAPRDRYFEVFKRVLTITLPAVLANPSGMVGTLEAMMTDLACIPAPPAGDAVVSPIPGRPPEVKHDSTPIGLLWSSPWLLGFLSLGLLEELTPLRVIGLD